MEWKQCTLLAAGSNAGGQLGLGHEDDAHILRPAVCEDGAPFPPADKLVIHLASGSNHTVAIVGNRGEGPVAMMCNPETLELWACGRGREGQLGRRITESVSSFRKLDLELDLDLESLLDEQEKRKAWRPVTLSCGWSSTFVAFSSVATTVEEDGSATDDVLLVLGRENDFGQLGTGEEKIDAASVHRIRLPASAPGLPASVSTPLRIWQLASGLRHTLALTQRTSEQEGRTQVQLYGWGAARHGQLDRRQDGQRYPLAYWQPHLVDEWSYDYPAAMPCRSLAAGKEHTAYHDSSREEDGQYNRVHVLGSDRQGQRQVVLSGEVDPTIVTAACTWSGTLLLDRSGTLIGSGNNTKGQLGSSAAHQQGRLVTADIKECLKEGKSRIDQIVCGSEHTLASVKPPGADGQSGVWGWGWNEHGNLAQNDEDDRKTPVQIWPSLISSQSADAAPASTARNIWAGCGTTFIQIQEP